MNTSYPGVPHQFPSMGTMATSNMASMPRQVQQFQMPSEYSLVSINLHFWTETFHVTFDCPRLYNTQFTFSHITFFKISFTKLIRMHDDIKVS